MDMYNCRRKKLETNNTTEILTIQLLNDQTWEEKKENRSRRNEPFGPLCPNPSPERLRHNVKASLRSALCNLHKIQSAVPPPSPPLFKHLVQADCPPMSLFGNCGQAWNLQLPLQTLNCKPTNKAQTLAAQLENIEILIRTETIAIFNHQLHTTSLRPKTPADTTKKRNPNTVEKTCLANCV